MVKIGTMRGRRAHAVEVGPSIFVRTVQDGQMRLGQCTLAVKVDGKDVAEKTFEAGPGIAAQVRSWVNRCVEAARA